jgi:hypothetical protein
MIPVLGWDVLQTQHELKLPRIPVNVKFRHAVSGPGYALLLENTSDQPLPLTAILEHPAMPRNTREFDLYVSPKSYVDVDEVTGWIGQPGDRIILKNSNFKPWRGSMP